MVSLEADHTGNTVFTDEHLLADEHPPVNPADGSEFQKTIVCDAPHNKAHLVHMSAEHQFVAGGFFSFFIDNQVSHGVRPHAVGVWFCPLHDKITHRFLKARHAV
ncbi:hypothetical protein SDC9_66484 [bioreactor metagenome]|uniref:Uncharacterized protein n=1 Tax=bioreactor metagenome TaxID=1076179 RepID=A0A644XVX4_9ZZZZ